MYCAADSIRSSQKDGLFHVYGSPFRLYRAGRPQSRRILLAEDNNFNQKVAVGMLEKMGHSITIAGNGREAVEMARTGMFDLILMDIQMPEMDGYQATAAIRQHQQQSGKHVPIVAMTAHAMAGDREKILQSGMDDYISKPITRQSLALLLDKWPPARPSPKALSS